MRRLRPPGAPAWRVLEVSGVRGGVTDSPVEASLRYPRLFRFSSTLAQLRSNWVGLIGLGIILFWILAALAAPWLAPFPPNANLVPFAPPGTVFEGSKTFLLGTDPLGRDILSRILYGARTVLVYAPALLRCRRIDFSIPEQFGGGDMGWLGCTLVFRPGLLRPPRTFAIGLEAYLLGQLPQRGDHRSGTHTAEDLPLILRDRNHHAMIGLGDVVGAIVEGEFLVNGLGTMHATQRRHHHRQHVVGDQGQAKTEQGGLGIAQGINFRMEIRFQVLEGRLQRPALAI